MFHLFSFYCLFIYSNIKIFLYRINFDLKLKKKFRELFVKWTAKNIQIIFNAKNEFAFLNLVSVTIIQLHSLLSNFSDMLLFSIRSSKYFNFYHSVTLPKPNFTNKLLVTLFFILLLCFFKLYVQFISSFMYSRYFYIELTFIPQRRIKQCHVDFQIFLAAFSQI